MTYFYYAVMKKEEEKEHSYVLRVNQSLDLASILKHYDFHIVQPCKTKKDAIKIANFWNECSLKNGKYIFERLYPARVFDA